MKEEIGVDKESTWLFNKYEKCSERYIEAEKFILELSHLKWWQRLFLNNRILNFLDSRSKYKF